MEVDLPMSLFINKQNAMAMPSECPWLPFNLKRTRLG